MASANVLQEWFPNTKLPVIISAPMLGSSNGTLAAQVTKAGGFGKPSPSTMFCTKVSDNLHSVQASFPAVTTSTQGRLSSPNSQKSWKPPARF